jgi:hypothetical protein
MKSKLKNRTPIGPLKDGNGRTVNGNKEMAEMLNDYFSSVFTNEADGPVPEAEHCHVDEELASVQVTGDMVAQKIRT